MMLKTVQGASIKSVFEVLKDLLNDVNFIFDSSGVSISTLDTAHVTFVSLRLLAENFEEYVCPHKIVAGLNMANTFKLLKIISNNDTLCMSSNNRDMLQIIVENDQKKSKTVFDLKLLDINEETFDMGALTFDVQTVVQSVVLQRTIRDMCNFASIVEIERYGKILKFTCKGDYVDQCTELECSNDFSGRICYTYSLKYINMFTKATNVCSNVTIYQNEDGAMLFRYSIANLGEIDFYLAPNADT
jgi:proliferating cell nuclear antigen